MKILSLSAAFLISSLLLFSCKKDNPIPPEEQPQIILTLEDVSCTEAWVKLTTANIRLPAEAILKQDNSVIQAISLGTADTLLYIDSLLPNQSYSFHSIIQSSNQSIKSGSLTVSTMDTTSHNFTWQSWSFGSAEYSILYDVAIIDENDIWAVGEIYLLDTLGQPDPNRYNLAFWNGYDWEIKRIPYYYQGQLYYHPIQSVFAFGANDIWFCGNGVIHWDGSEYIPISIPSSVWGPYQMNKLWGTSSSDLYVVGNNGNIAHYNGQAWTKIETGTELNINDIWGYTDNFGNRLVLCAASDLGTNHQKKLLRINDNSVDTLDWSPQKTLYTIWFPSTHKIYAGGGKTYAKCGNDWIEQTSVNFFTYGIRGNDFNDVYAVGGGHFSHFNGYTWKEISALFLSGGNYEGIATKGGIICSVGYLGNKAIAAIITK